MKQTELSPHLEITCTALNAHSAEEKDTSETLFTYGRFLTTKSCTVRISYSEKKQAEKEGCKKREMKSKMEKFTL